MHKGYKCLTQEGKIVISKDVVFNEMSFPYTMLFLSLPAPASSSSHVSATIPRVSQVPSSPPTAPSQSSESSSLSLPDHSPSLPAHSPPSQPRNSVSSHEDTSLPTSSQSHEAN